MALNHDNVLQMQQIKFDLFKTQDPEIGRFNIIFEVEGKLLFAHKTMLNLVSDTFDAMLADRWMKNKDIPIKIESYGYDDFKQFLTFLYSGECQLTQTNISSMVDIAEFYGVALFKNYCDKYLAAMEVSTANVFQLMELADKYSLVHLKASALGFITENFLSFADCDGFLNASKSVIERIITSVKDAVKPEDIFQAVFKWSEIQAENKKVADPNLNLSDQIKAEISDFFSYIHFDKMEHKFFCEFVGTLSPDSRHFIFLVPRGYIFSSLNELSTILCDRIVPKVKITNGRGQTLHGKLKCDNAFIEAIKALKSANSLNGTARVNWWDVELQQPSTPNPLKKRDGVQWYLIYHPDAELIGYAHFSRTYPNEVVLAELTTESADFKATVGSKIEIE